MAKSKLRQDYKQGFYDGYVCALSCLIRSHGNGQEANDVRMGIGPIVKERTDPIDWQVLVQAGYVVEPDGTRDARADLILRVAQGDSYYKLAKELNITSTQVCRMVWRQRTRLEMKFDSFRCLRIHRRDLKPVDFLRTYKDLIAELWPKLDLVDQLLGCRS